MPKTESELKDIYVKLLEEHSKLLDSALSSIIHKSDNKAEYGKDDKQKIENHEYFKAFSDRKRWPYYGILNEKELARLTLLEHILSPNSKEVRNYPEWKNREHER